MPKIFIPGDFVWCLFPYQDNPAKIERRPGMIIKIEMAGTTPYFFTAKVTTTDNSHYINGKWVTKSSKLGKVCQLPEDSFIHLENIARLPRFALREYIGSYPNVQELIDICVMKGLSPFNSLS